MRAIHGAHPFGARQSASKFAPGEFVTCPIPGVRPAGSLRLSNFAPDEIVPKSCSSRQADADRKKSHAARTAPIVPNSPLPQAGEGSG